MAIFADFRVVLDACVLAKFGVADVFLTFAETPRLYLPRWSEQILEETRRTHQEKLKWPEHLIESFQTTLRAHFPEALVTGYERFIDLCDNDPKDRHVLACAIACQAEIIATYNLRDFPPDALKKWNVTAMHPQDQLLSIYGLDPLRGLHKLAKIAFRRNQSLKDYLIDLGCFLPAFSSHVIEAIG
jgi:predicted nucleic acid-binding protein